jgi:hypothetical protein
MFMHLGDISGKFTHYIEIALPFVAKEINQ